MQIELSETDLEHLVFICGIARDYYDRSHNLPMELYWRKQAELYAQKFAEMLIDG